MNARLRENLSLDFKSFEGRCSVQETFYPWDITIEKLLIEGLSTDPYAKISLDDTRKSVDRDTFLGNPWAKSVMLYESDLGFDPVLRIGITLPMIPMIKEVIGKDYLEDEDDFKALLDYSNTILGKYFNDTDFYEVYEPFKAGHSLGEYSVRVNVMGFFFAPRELLGIEEHLYSFYDKPELLHMINEHILGFYEKYLVKLLKILPVDVIYFSEDLSGKNGPMISPAIFKEFVTNYYKRLFPILRNAGAKYLFVDTDGDFRVLISGFLESGVDGFLPMDVNAGMDIVQVRKEFPRLRFIGGYNKLVIAQGKEAIDKEFDRIMPVVEQGGYIIGCDHQLPPEASLDNYKYYIKRLKEISTFNRHLA